MPGDAGEKTEAPTPRRREEARNKGQVARSQDLSAALLMLGTMILLRTFGGRLLAMLIASLQRNLDVNDPASAAALDVRRAVASVATGALAAAGPLMLGMIVLGLLAHLVQVGFLVSSESLTPNLSKLSPISGLKRLFSTRTLVQFAMNLLKLAFVSGAGYVAICSRLDKIMLALDVGGWQQIAVMSTVLYEVGVILASVLLVLALLDYAWQRWKHEQELKMTKEEVKEELRRMEGDPLIKQRRRRMQLTALVQQIRKEVPKADVVVTNPTEFAVAIRYDAKAMGAPRVVAKGQDYLAIKIREIAIEHGVPIVERKPLAQALYKTVDVGQEIPEQFYKAVAEILAYVYELSGKARRMRAAPSAA